MSVVEQYPWRDPERLEEQYVEKDRTQQEMADEWGCSVSTINKWLKRHEIETERGSNVQTIQGVSPCGRPYLTDISARAHEQMCPTCKQARAIKEAIA